jgi:predicted ATP-grasp superfamily ATP-dependent carboligase
VLGLSVTGLGVVRSLAEHGVAVYGVSFSLENNPGRYSRLCQVVNRFGALNHPEQFLEWLIDYLRSFGNKPVLIPTSDFLALFVADHHDRLSVVARCFTTDLTSFEQIVCKDLFYQNAADSGVSPPPFLNRPTPDTARAWCAANEPPYLLKPVFQEAGNNVLGEKNRFFSSVEKLHDFISGIDTSGLILMRVLKGGDGYIFDTYGYCDRHGRVVTLASHRRLRQQAPDFGSTCYGEIPADQDKNIIEAMFSKTLKLLGQLDYHGIFGIEWLQDQSTGELFVLDFNARPFTTISHLNDAGLNLPYLAYRELCDQDVSGFTERPTTRHLFWVDFNRDTSTFRARHRRGEMSVADWLKSLLRCRSFACWRFSDPGPALYQFLSLCERVLSKFRRK